MTSCSYLSFHVQGTEIPNEALAIALQAAKQDEVTFSTEEMEQFNYEVWPYTEHTLSQIGYIKGIPVGDDKPAVVKYFRPRVPRAYKKFEGQLHTGRNTQQSAVSCLE